VTAATPSRARVVLADDDVLLREGLASLLERSGFEVVGQAGDGVQLLALVREHVPDLVVVDIRMPPTHTTEGLEAAQVIRQEAPQAGILVLSAHVEVEHAMQLLAGGTGSVTCSSVASPMWGSSSRRWSGSPGAGRWWTRPWWPSWWAPAATKIR
jgi:DNA-binding NarL/FixJ family response regulator